MAPKIRRKKAPFTGDLLTLFGGVDNNTNDNNTNDNNTIFPFGGQTEKDNSKEKEDIDMTEGSKFELAGTSSTTTTTPPPPQLLPPLPPSQLPPTPLLPQSPGSNPALQKLRKQEWVEQMWLASKAIEEALKLATEETTKVATKELLHHALAVRNGTPLYSFTSTQQIAKDLKAIRLSLAQPPLLPPQQQLPQQPPQQPPQQQKLAKQKSYAEAATLAATPTTTLTAPAPMPTPRRTVKQQRTELEDRQLVVITNAQAKPVLDPLQQRNAINASLPTTTTPVVAGVSISTNNNLILTTTPDFTADYLL